MGSIGAPELLVVLIVGLIVLGPNRLPQAAKQVGKAVAEFRRVTSGLQAEMRDAFTDPVESAPPAPVSPAVAQDVIEVTATADKTPAPWANPAIPVEGPPQSSNGHSAE